MHSHQHGATELLPCRMTKQDNSESIHRLGGVPFLRAASRKPAAVAMARSMLSTEMKPNSCTLSIDITTAVHEATCATTACEHVSLPSTAQHPAAPNHLRHHAHDPLHVRWCVKHWLAHGAAISAIGRCCAGGGRFCDVSMSSWLAPLFQPVCGIGLPPQPHVGCLSYWEVRPPPVQWTRCSTGMPYSSRSEAAAHCVVAPAKRGHRRSQCHDIDSKRRTVTHTPSETSCTALRPSLQHVGAWAIQRFRPHEQHVYGT